MILGTRVAQSLPVEPTESLIDSDSIVVLADGRSLLRMSMGNPLLIMTKGQPETAEATEYKKVWYVCGGSVFGYRTWHETVEGHCCARTFRGTRKPRAPAHSV